MGRRARHPSVAETFQVGFDFLTFHAYNHLYFYLFSVQFSCPFDSDVICDPEVVLCSTDRSWLRVCGSPFSGPECSFCYPPPPAFVWLLRLITSAGCFLFACVCTRPHFIVILHLITSWYCTLLAHVVCLLLYTAPLFPWFWRTLCGWLTSVYCQQIAVPSYYNHTLLAPLTLVMPFKSYRRTSCSNQHIS
jgi:hypothetical protein